MIKPAKTPLYLLLLAGLALPLSANAQHFAPAPQAIPNHFAAGQPQGTPYIAPQLQGPKTFRLAPPQLSAAPRSVPMMMGTQPVRRVVAPVPVGRYAPPARARMRPQAPLAGRYGSQQHNHAPKKSGLLDKLLNRGDDKYLYANYRDRLNGARLPHYQYAPQMPHPMDQFLRWQDNEADYALYPGDQVDIVVGSAPELSRTLTIGPDGRVVMPMTQPIMAAGKSMKDLEAAISAELAKQLVDPRVAVTPRAYGPQQIFVGGQVGAQGTYTLPGPVGVTEAVMMAGGFANSARLHQVVVMRRAPSGAFMARTIDFRDGLHNPLSLADNVQLRRGDIVFVPRSDIAEVGLFMQQYVRDALPVGLNLSYNLGETRQ